MVEVLVDLLGLAVLLEQPAENTLAAHPLHLGGKTSIGGTLPLTGAGVATLPLGLVHAVHTSTRVDVHRLADDVAILDQLTDVLAGVSHGDLIDLIGIQPDFALAAFENRGGEALLKAKRHHPCDKDTHGKHKSIPLHPQIAFPDAHYHVHSTLLARIAEEFGLGLPQHSPPGPGQQANLSPRRTRLLPSSPSLPCPQHIAMPATQAGAPPSAAQRKLQAMQSRYAERRPRRSDIPHSHERSQLILSVLPVLPVLPFHATRA